MLLDICSSGPRVLGWSGNGPKGEATNRETCFLSAGITAGIDACLLFSVALSCYLGEALTPQRPP